MDNLSPSDSVLFRRDSAEDTRSSLNGNTKTPVSLRLKLTILVVAINSIVTWATCGVFWLYQQIAIDDAVDTLRVQRASMTAEQLRTHIPHDTARTLHTVASELGHLFVNNRFAVEVYDTNGVLLQSSQPFATFSGKIDVVKLNITDQPVVTEMLGRFTQGHPKGIVPVRLAIVPIKGADGNRYLVSLIGGEDGLAQQQAELLRGVIFIVMLVGPIAAALSGWFIAGIAVAPFERLRQLASRLNPDSEPSSLETDSFGASKEVMHLAHELDAARARVAERFAAQERFLSNVSHEIKTPISVILTESQTIDRSSLPPRAAKFVDSVREEMSRLGRLVESFLSLSRIQDGKGLARFQPYAINDLIVDSIDNCRKFASHYHVRVHPVLLDHEDVLDTAVSGEPDLLRTMLDNLVINAVRFSPESGQVRVIASLSEKDPAQVEITVEDDGPGIPPDRVESIFDRFAQASNQPRQGRGHGLGLTIALGIAELHNGTIRVRNRMPNGCAFTIVLPVRNSQANPDDRTTSS